jgi:hypothetical protein
MTLTENQMSHEATSNQVIDIPVNRLGIDINHLVRPVDEQYVAELLETDENEWEPIEVRPWPSEWEKPSPNAYAWGGRLLSKALEAEQIPWYWMVDPGRRHFTHPSDSLREFIDRQSRAFFWADVWKGQPRRPEICVEKEAMAAFVYNTVDDLRIPVRVMRGYTSVTAVKEAALHYGNGKGWTILYLGDFDPSGLNIESSFKKKLAQYGSRPTIRRVALTLEDTRALPSYAGLDLKEGDPRTKAFREMYGKDQKGYELDAMGAVELRQQLLSVVHEYLDLNEFNQAQELERLLAAEATRRKEEPHLCM